SELLGTFHLGVVATVVDHDQVGAGKYLHRSPARVDVNQTIAPSPYEERRCLHRAQYRPRRLTTSGKGPHHLSVRANNRARVIPAPDTTTSILDECAQGRLRDPVRVCEVSFEAFFDERLGRSPDVPPVYELAEDGDGGSD